MVSVEEVYNKLREIVDLEIGINIVDLGLIYNVQIEEDTVHIVMTLTSPLCPMSRKIVSDVKKAVESLGAKANVEITFDPPWSPDRISDEVKKSLGLK